MSPVIDVHTHAVGAAGEEFGKPWRPRCSIKEVKAGQRAVHDADRRHVRL